MPSSGGKTCALDRKSTRLNSSHGSISYAVFCLKKINRDIPNVGEESLRDLDEDGIIRLLPAEHMPLLSDGTPVELILNPICVPSFFFFNDTAATELYSLSLHDALRL